MTLNKIKTVIVDDHAIVREGLEIILQLTEEIKIIGTASGYDELLKILQSDIPDILLLDIGLPGLSGIEISEKLKKTYPGIKIIILTANPTEKNIFDAVNAGVMGFIPKNAGKKILEEAIRTVADGEEYFHRSVSQVIIKNLIRKQRGNFTKETTLSSREIEIIKLICEGMTHKKIAETLFISKRTVDNHVQNIMAKTGLHSKAGLIKYAFRERLADI